MRYLLCSDGSAASGLAFARLSQLVKEGDTIFLLGVRTTSMQPERERLVRDALEKHHAELEEQGFQAEILMPAGYPREVIVATAEELEVDVIVLGSVGMNPSSKSTLGSTSEYVAVHASAACLIVK